MISYTVNREDKRGRTQYGFCMAKVLTVKIYLPFLKKHTCNTSNRRVILPFLATG